MAWKSLLSAGIKTKVHGSLYTSPFKTPYSVLQGRSWNFPLWPLKKTPHFISSRDCHCNLWASKGPVWKGTWAKCHWNRTALRRPCSFNNCFQWETVFQTPYSIPHPRLWGSAGIGGKQLGGSTAVPSEEHTWGSQAEEEGVFPGWWHAAFLSLEPSKPEELQFPLGTMT